MVYQLAKGWWVYYLVQYLIVFKLIKIIVEKLIKGQVFILGLEILNKLLLNVNPFFPL